MTLLICGSLVGPGFSAFFSQKKITEAVAVEVVTLIFGERKSPATVCQTISMAKQRKDNHHN